LGAAPACKRTRGACSAAAVTIALLSLICTAAAATDAATPTWGVQLPAKRLPSTARLKQLQRNGLTAIVVEARAVTPTQRSRLAAAARRAGLQLVLPRASAPNLRAFCRSARSGASRNCAPTAGTPKAAIRLARRNVADYIVIRLAGLGQLRFLKGVKAKTRILAVAKPSDRTLNRVAWSRAVAIAAEDPTLDLAIAVDSPTQSSLTAFTALVRSARGGTKTALDAEPVPGAPAPTSPSGPTAAGAGASATPDTAAPSAPTGLAATTSSQTSITLVWSPSTDDVGVAGYGVYRNGALVGSTALSISTVPGLSCSTTYVLEVDAFDAAGNRSARTSVSRATSACAPGADTTPPTAPGSPAKTAGTTTSITVAWAASSDNTAVAGYGLYRSGVLQATVTGTSYTFTPLVCGTTYALGVDAYDAAGNRSAVSSFNAATSACPADTQAPSVPQGMTTTAASETAITIAWNASTDNVGVTGYGLYRDGTLVGTTSSLSYSFSGLSCGTTYALGVQALDAAGNASYLPESILTSSTAACPPPPPSGGAASVFVSPSGSDANACSQAAPCKTFDRAYRVAACGATVSLAGGSYPTQTINAPEKECSSYITFTPASGAVVTTQTVTIRSGDWIKFLGNSTNFLMRDNGSVGSTSGFYLSPTGTGMNEPVDHIWVEGLDFETFLLRGADDVTFKNNDIGPGKNNHYDEKLWVSVGHDGSNYVNNYSTNLVLDGNTIHSFTRDACAASGCHVECLTMEAENFIIKNNQFLDCDIFGIILGQDQGFSTIGTQNVIEDNIIHCCKTTSGYALALGDTEQGSLVTIRRNEFRGSVTTDLGGSLGTIRTCANTGNIPTTWKATC
jgi:chitodextrinase